MNTTAVGTVLIVDDEIKNCKLLDVLLRSQGLRTVMATSGKEALALIARQTPDLLLLDVMMPDMDGYQVAKALKANPVTSNIPIIMLTALLDREVRMAGLAAGAEEFLTKPVDRAELELRVRNLLRLKELGDFHKNHNHALEQQVQARTVELGNSIKLQLSETAKEVAILNALPTHIAMLDMRGFIVEVNEAWRRFASSNHLASPDFGIGTNYLEICENAKNENSCGAAETAAGIKAVLNGELTSFSLEYPCHSADEQRWFMMTVSPVSAGAKSGAIIMHLNITANTLARQEIVRLNVDLEERVRQRTVQLLAANQELEAFSYSVSHDLRTPLTTIDGFSTLLAKELGTASDGVIRERAERYVSRIRSGVSQMTDLIESMLSLAQITRTPLRWESVDLSVIADTVLNGYREREPTRPVRIEIKPGLRVQGDPRLLRQVMENLMGNAWKFSARQPETQISFSSKIDRHGEHVYSLQDNGAGFDMAQYDKLFGAFQRLHSVEVFAGTGIGLVTVHRIVARHGGRVWADSVLGEGARFSFTLGKTPPEE